MGRSCRDDLHPHHAALIIIDHTEVDSAFAGRNGPAPLAAAVQWARETQTKVMATCPFASAQFARDPSIRDVLA
jgi:predicted GNAT family acetyltransferase